MGCVLWLMKSPRIGAFVKLVKHQSTRHTDTRHISYLIDTFVAIDKPELLPGELTHHYAVYVLNSILIVVVNGGVAGGRGQKGHRAHLIGNVLALSVA